MHSLNRASLALNTDLYELTMAQSYWQLGIQDYEAAFHLFFRKPPFHGNFAVAAGLASVIEYLEQFSFDESDIRYLATLKNKEGQSLFMPEFLTYLLTMRFSCSVDAVPEGTPVCPQAPMLRVIGPILQAQLLEGALLNIINFQSLIATKAARICRAAENDQVIEFGLRRAQGMDGALSAARAAYVGGCHASSNALAGKCFDIPVRGTHAHSWVLSFDSEIASFRAYAECMPDNCVFLVDTYDTIRGVRSAIKVAQELREKGHEMIGVRIDSGDLAHLSIQVRELLDASGFSEAKIMASNELDEYLIRDLKQQGARIDTWGVGTNLITARDQPALDGVYKLTALRKPGEAWRHKLKLSEQTIKTTLPGVLQVRRFSDERGYCADMIYDIGAGVGSNTMAHFYDPAHEFTGGEVSKDLLEPIFDRGERVYAMPTIHEARQNTIDELGRFQDRYLRFLHPHTYFLGEEQALRKKKMALIREVQG